MDDITAKAVQPTNSANKLSQDAPEPTTYLTALGDDTSFRGLPGCCAAEEEAVWGCEGSGAGALAGAEADVKDLDEVDADAGLAGFTAGGAPTAELALAEEGLTSESVRSTETSEPVRECRRRASVLSSCLPQESAIIRLNSCSI